MRKQKISISVDEKTLKRIDENIELGRFRNCSHAFEFSLQKILEAK
jgi:Arc/MetJ-type ribon-helix-helix transcriptional regulator